MFNACIHSVVVSRFHALEERLRSATLVINLGKESGSISLPLEVNFFSPNHHIVSEHSPSTTNIMANTSDGFYSPSKVLTALLAAGVKGRTSPSILPEEAAAARAKFRFNMRLDGRHSLTYNKDGMHPNYLEVLLDKDRQQFILDSENDAFDAVSRFIVFIPNGQPLMCECQLTALDRIDGGFTVMMHCVGKVLPKTGPTWTLDDLELLVYLPLREVDEYRYDLQWPIGQIAQLFGREIALPHLHHLLSRCHVSKVEPMRVIQPFDLEQSETKERDIELLPNPKNETKFKLRCYEQQAFESYASQGKKRVAEVVDSESVYEGDSSLDYDEVSRVLDKVEREFFPAHPPHLKNTRQRLCLRLAAPPGTGIFDRPCKRLALTQHQGSFLPALGSVCLLTPAHLCPSLALLCLSSWSVPSSALPLLKLSSVLALPPTRQSTTLVSRTSG
jgi:hypothetical protein